MVMLAVAVELRPDVGKGIAVQARQLVQVGDRVLDLLGIVPLLPVCIGSRRAGDPAEVANVAFHGDRRSGSAGPRRRHR